MQSLMLVEVYTDITQNTSEYWLLWGAVEKSSRFRFVCCFVCVFLFFVADVWVTVLWNDRSSCESVLPKNVLPQTGEMPSHGKKLVRKTQKKNHWKNARAEAFFLFFAEIAWCCHSSEIMLRSGRRCLNIVVVRKFFSNPNPGDSSEQGWERIRETFDAVAPRVILGLVWSELRLLCSEITIRRKTTRFHLWTISSDSYLQVISSTVLQLQ